MQHISPLLTVTSACSQRTHTRKVTPATIPFSAVLQTEHAARLYHTIHCSTHTTKLCATVGSVLLSAQGRGIRVLPHVPTALSTPEGFPWMILSPWNAHLLISSISTSPHLLKHIEIQKRWLQWGFTLGIQPLSNRALLSPTLCLWWVQPRPYWHVRTSETKSDLTSRIYNEQASSTCGNRFKKNGDLKTIKIFTDDWKTICRLLEKLQPNGSK